MRKSPEILLAGLLLLAASVCRPTRLWATEVSAPTSTSHPSEEDGEEDESEEVANQRNAPPVGSPSETVPQVNRDSASESASVAPPAPQATDTDRVNH